MLCPLSYQKDLHKVLGKVLDHKFPDSQEEELKHLTNARNLWEKKFGDKFSFYLDEKESVPSYVTQISYNLEAAILRQRDFFYNVSLPHFTDAKFLENAVERYKGFLNMKKMHR